MLLHDTPLIYAAQKSGEGLGLILLYYLNHKLEHRICNDLHPNGDDITDDTSTDRTLEADI